MTPPRSPNRSTPSRNSAQRSLKAALPSLNSSMHSSRSERYPPPKKLSNHQSSALTPPSPPLLSTTSALAYSLKNFANHLQAASTPSTALARRSLPPTPTKESPSATKARTNAFGAERQVTGPTTAWQRKVDSRKKRQRMIRNGGRQSRNTPRKTRERFRRPTFQLSSRQRT